MSGSAGRQPSTWLTVLAGVLAVGFWTFNALQATFGDDDLSIRALFIYISLVPIGLALATVLDVFTAPGRARWRGHGGSLTRLDDPKRQNLLSALWMLGFGAGPILDASPGTLGWAILVIGSLGGGLTLGVAYALASEQRSAPQGRPTEVNPPTRYDWW